MSAQQPVIDGHALLIVGQAVGAACFLIASVLFAMQVAFAATMQSYGIQPGAVIGHSLGGAAAGLALARGLQADRAVLLAPAADPVASTSVSCPSVMSPTDSAAATASSRAASVSR